MNEIMQLAKKTGLEKEAQGIIAQVTQSVSKWYIYAEQANGRFQGNCRINYKINEHLVLTEGN